MVERMVEGEPVAAARIEEGALGQRTRRTTPAGVSSRSARWLQLEGRLIDAIDGLRAVAEQLKHEDHEQIVPLA